MEYKYSDWTQIKVTVKQPQLEPLSAIMSVIDINLMIEDYSDFELNGMYGELVGDEILNADRTIASVSVFIPDGGDTEGVLSFLRERLAAAGIEGTVEVAGVHEADWANTWRQYYKPLHIGERIVIVPTWEEYTPSGDELTVSMDPGMAFGTGSHETTKLVIGLLEKNVTPGCSVLDVGCGSGILAICASKLGAGLCRAYDLSDIAVDVAQSNAKLNECNVECGQSDLLSGIAPGEYDIICANIVADIIIRMLPDIRKYMHKNSTLIVSGIITERAGEVADAVEASGLYIAQTLEDNGWCAMCVKLLV